MNPLRYFLRSIAFSALRGPVRLRYVGVLAGRAIGGWLAARVIGRCFRLNKNQGEHHVSR